MAVKVEHYRYTTQIDQKSSVCQWIQAVHQNSIKVYDQLKTYGVHSVSRLRAAGFTYTKDGDTTKCETCGLEVSGWIREMDPFEVHRDRSPNCSFVQSILSNNKRSNDQFESAVKRQKTEQNSNSYDGQIKIIEVNTLQKIRRRTFSKWDDKILPGKEQMIRAGFLHCNVGDRVICLYCNLICQQWQRDIDDPVEVHKTLSPHCGYVRLILALEGSSSVVILNEFSTDNTNNRNLLNQADGSQFDQIVRTSPCHPNYASIPSRHATFTAWNTESSPSVDDLVRAGFFYANVKNSVTCFFCDGALQNWSKDDDPLIEHIRWYSMCQYAKQLAGIDLFNKVQEAKRAREEQQRAQNSNNTTQNASVSNRFSSLILDDKLLTRFVAARLDLPCSQRLLDLYFKLSVIKRCWEDQLRLKHDDFLSDTDLYMACLILQKQIEHINGNKENIVIPSKRMQMIREREQAGGPAQEQLASSTPSSSSSSSSSSEKTAATAQSTATVSQPTQIEVTTELVKKEDETTMDTNTIVNNPCVLCGKEEKRLAAIPCGHLISCVKCSQTLRTCPICRHSIEAFVRIFI